MTVKQRILAVLELDNAPDSTLERAIWLAKLLGRPIDILLCEHEAWNLFDNYISSHETSTMRGEIDRSVHEILDDFREQALSSGLQVSSSLIDTRPVAEAIIRHADETDPCVVVKGTHFHSVAERSILVDTDWMLMRQCVYPLWLVKSKTLREHPVVVAAVDPMRSDEQADALDDRIIIAGQAITKPLSGDLHLLHTYMRLAAVGKIVNRALKSEKLPIDEIDDRIKKEHREALTRIAEKHGIDEQFVHQLPGRTHEILPAFVRSHKADLVVMGALARWETKRVFIGSTAERVMDHLPCDLLIVRDNEFSLTATSP